MPHYTFSTHKDGILQEELGSMELFDTEAAVTFAISTLRDILRDNPRDYAGWTLGVTQEGRPIVDLSYCMTSSSLQNDRSVQ